MKRIGNYQRTVLRGIAREGRQPVSIKNGYSRQVKTLKKRKLIKQKGNFLYLTPTGRKRVKIPVRKKVSRRTT